MKQTTGPDLDLEKMRRYAASKTSARLVKYMKIDVEVRGFAVTLYEARALWTPEIGPEWTRIKIARLTFHATRQHWALSWSDRNGTWHRYDRIQPGGIDAMLQEIDDDPTYIFWG